MMSQFLKVQFSNRLLSNVTFVSTNARCLVTGRRNVFGGPMLSLVDANAITRSRSLAELPLSLRS
jgi:hypothetical protein